MRGVSTQTVDTDNAAHAEISLSLDTKDLAQLYDTHSDYQYDGGKTLVAKMGISPNWSVLDIGSGTGQLGSHVARLVGPAGHVFGIEPLEERVALSQSRAGANLSFAVGDAQDLSRFPSGSFDAVYMNSVIHWVPDQRKALAEAHRVLRQGGVIGIATGSGEHPQPHGVIKKRVLSGERYRGFVGPTQSRANPTRGGLEELLGGAGFREVDVELLEGAVETDDAKGMVDFVQAYSFGNFLGHLPEDLQRAARDDLEREFGEFRTEGGKIRMQGMTRLFAVAVRA
ncbi:hypothetical protein HIM_07491 [Hirsutella minnesotensis 3608]|uniref:Methyltransferase type 11 domain-containing protein n=1 Tax=Hirsutella minnesotensis 3608 TaxID=1043627 RepID=A0A0F7ZYV0_9HYPO|nr:hypothetical protein HIM_07491 [Hirsutella minnesotensis 3608]